MLIAVVSAGIGVLLFLCLYLGFRTGLRLGMQAVKGQVPKKMNPVVSVKQAVAESKQDKEQTDLMKGFTNMMAFTGEPKKGM